MVKLKKFSATAALVIGLSLNLQGAAFSQSLKGPYKAVLNCAKLPFTDVSLNNEPVGTIALTGGWTGKRDAAKAGYNCKIAAGETVLSGKQVVSYLGRPYDRSCTMTIKN